MELVTQMAWLYGGNLSKEGEQVAQQIAEMAEWALVEEVRTTPKPGLVDCYSNGAHTDMNLQTFLKSAAALRPYFKRMAECGWLYYQTPERIFLKIREIGKEAERAMYRATEGINTHKGLVFSIGILGAAAASVYRRYGRFVREAVFATEQKMVQKILFCELAQQHMRPATHGEAVYHKYGSMGARGEALTGYATVREVALPMLESGMREEHEFELVKLQTLLALMGQVEDSNILSRSSMERLREVQHMARAFLNMGGMYRCDSTETMKKWDALFVQWNISPGGSADLLATTLFLYRLTGGNL